jgi:Putative bacterial sensory transduction regulator
VIVSPPVHSGGCGAVQPVQRGAAASTADLIAGDFKSARIGYRYARRAVAADRGSDMKSYLVAAFASLVFAGAAQAQVRSMDPQSIVRVMQEAGYKAELGKDGTGDPQITSGASGAKFTIYFYGCEKNQKCTEIQFYAGWSDKLTLERINAWNAEHRFGRAYLDDKGEVNIEYDLNFEDQAIPAALFKNDLELWASLVGSFVDFITEDDDSKES